MKRFLFLTCLIIFYCIKVSAQQRIEVTGIVKDTTGKTMSGVSIKTEGGGAISDDNGKFTVFVKSLQSEITATYIGYVTLRIKLNGHKDISIILTPNTKSDLQDVVVIGMQQQSMRTTVSSISGIVSKDIENRPVASVDVLLQGRIAGLNVQVSSGEPGVAPTVVVRGNSTVNTSIGDNANVQQAQAMSGPLYVIDGIPIDPADIANNAGATGTNFLAGLNVNDIESVQVQKDAAATAAWGSRGANGVIYITTKKGTSKVPVFGVNVYYGVNQKPKLIPTLTGSAEREAKLNIINQYATTAAQLAALPHLLTDSLNPSFNNATDWQGLFYQAAPITNIDATMSAASEDYNYRLSMGYYNTQGIIRNTGYQRYSLRGNFGFKISPKLNSQLVLAMVKENRQAGQKYQNSDANTPFSGSSQPTSFYYVNGFDSSGFLGISSKLRNINLNDNYQASMTTNYDILPGLRYTLQGGANVYVTSKDYFQPSNVDVVGALTGGNPSQPSYAESDRGTYSTYLVTNTLNYNKEFKTKAGNSHNLNLTASQQYTSLVSSGNTASGYNTPTNDIKTVTGIPQSDLSGSSYYQKDALLSLIGQIQYNYNQRYLLYGSYRADASSRFGNNNKWGYFPAVGIGWIVSDEKFMSGIKNTVNFFKLRFSMGSSGKNAYQFYPTFNEYNLSGTYNGTQAVQPSYTNGLTKNNLTWAKSVQKDLGFDLQMFNNRVILNTDFYDKLDKNQFFNFTLPFFTGYNSVYYNAKDLWVDNRGIDITLNTHNLSPKSAIQWNSQLVLTFQKNLIAKLPNNNRTFVIDDYNSGVSRVYAVGQPIYEMFQMHYEGVYNNQSEIPFNPLTGNPITYFKGYYPVKPGYPKWKDANGDGDVWSDEDNGDQYGDRIPTGDPNPKFVGGFSNDFTYKNFTLTISSVFTFKRTVVNTFFQQQLDGIAGSVNNLASHRLPDLSGLNYWTPEKAQDPNYKANFPSISPYSPYFYQFLPFTDMFNVDGSYFKVKNIILNYVLPSKFTNKLKIKHINVYAMMYNVLILKNKNNTMPDPEAVDQLGVYDGGLYPQAKTYTVGLNIQF
ncbi:SusC/RagA family TonB-linked outer membrane protein [Arachidicoccus soli]|nr:SusC/RagA family TonB-linked outer membrane protein [Arachidicoccus soli]